MPVAKPIARSQSPSEKKPGNDNRLAYILSIALFLIVMAFLLVWAQIQLPKRTYQPDIAYTEFNALRVHNHGYAMLANFSVQTAGSNAGWVRRHEKEIREVLRHAFANAEPEKLRNPEGMTALQGMLRDAVNAVYPDAHIENVLLTDFILQPQDE
jgi:flagellar basal body-associated protein FliL